LSPDVPAIATAKPNNASQDLTASSTSPIPTGTVNSTLTPETPIIATAKPVDSSLGLTASPSSTRVPTGTVGSTVAPEIINATEHPAIASQVLTAAPKVVSSTNMSSSVSPMLPVIPFNANITRSESPDFKPFFVTQTPSVYECQCMNLSAGDVRDARDFIEYGVESKLMAQLRESVKCQKNPKLLAVLSCNVEPALNAIVGMSSDEVSELCLYPQVEPKKQISRSMPGIPNAGYIKNTKIPALSQNEDQRYGFDVTRQPRTESQIYRSNMPRQAVVDIRKTKRTYVGTPVQAMQRISASDY